MNIQEFDFSVNLLQALIWEYNETPVLTSLITQKQDWYDVNQQEFWEEWYTDVFNLQTANEFGLSVWSQILGIPLFGEVHPDPPGKPIWGFGVNYQNFENGTFTTQSGEIYLTTEQKRLVLKLRYFQLATRGDVLDINKFMAFAFQDYGDVWVIDRLDMSMFYIFDFAIDPVLLNFLIQYDILARPAAVGVRYIPSNTPFFGFGTNYKNFNNGCFF